MKNQPPPFARPRQQVPYTPPPRPATAAEVTLKIVGGRYDDRVACVDSRDLDALRSGENVRFHEDPDQVSILSRRAYDRRLREGKLEGRGGSFAWYRWARFTVPVEANQYFVGDTWWTAIAVSEQKGLLLVSSLVPIIWSTDQAKAVAMMTKKHSFAEVLKDHPGVQTTYTTKTI